MQAELKDVNAIYSADYAFAAKLADGSVVTWGEADRGGTAAPCRRN